MRLTPRQEQIIAIVKDKSPITGERIAEMLNLRRATLRPDLAVLTMAGLLEARPRVGYFCSDRVMQVLAANAIRCLKVDEVRAVPVVVKGETSVYDSIVAMFTEDIGTLFIVDGDGLLEGVVSRKDLLRVALGNTDLHRIPVQVVMTKMPNVLTIDGDELVVTAAKKLVDHEIDALPVIERIDLDGKERLKVSGRFTKTMVARLFVETQEGK